MEQAIVCAHAIAQSSRISIENERIENERIENELDEDGSSMQRSEDSLQPSECGRTTVADLSKQRDSAEAKAPWRKPSMEAISCGLEINCYTAGKGRRG